LQLSASQIKPDGTVQASVDLENVGQREGTEVVQLYIRAMAASMTRPVKELKGFERVTVKPGEKRRVSFELTPNLLAGYNRELKPVVEPGEFKVMVGNNSNDVTEQSFRVISQ
jgi:beta-glucosidase